MIRLGSLAILQAEAHHLEAVLGVLTPRRYLLFYLASLFGITRSFKWPEIMIIQPANGLFVSFAYNQFVFNDLNFILSAWLGHNKVMLIVTLTVSICSLKVHYL